MPPLCEVPMPAVSRNSSRRSSSQTLISRRVLNRPSGGFGGVFKGDRALSQKRTESGRTALALFLVHLLREGRDERRDIGGVARPQFAADRPPLAVEHGPDDHLVQVGPMVFAEASLAQVFPAITLEVDGGGVEEYQLKVREEIPPVGEQLLFDPVLDAPWGERCPSLRLVLGQLLSEPGHSPVE